MCMLTCMQCRDEQLCVQLGVRLCMAIFTEDIAHELSVANPLFCKAETILSLSHTAMAVVMLQ